MTEPAPPTAPMAVPDAVEVEAGVEVMPGEVTVPDWASLPGAVRARIVDWAARSLSGLAPAELPSGLAKVAKFTPAKRAKLGAGPLAQAVVDDAAFRATVAELARQETTAGVAVDDVSAAAAAYLLHLPDHRAKLDRVGRADQVEELRARVADQERSLMRLRSRVETITSERDQARRELADAAPAAERELDKLRSRLREQGVRIRALEQQVAAARDETAQAVGALETELATARAAAVNAQSRAADAADRADRAARALTAARDEAGRDRAAADRRLDLLLTTLQGATAGLRRELMLTGGGADPADIVAAALPSAAPGRSRSADPAMLSSWLQLPAAHLIVDGYNVTKTGYPELALVDQRDRLIRGLASLAARTSADITVVFDGAAVTTAQPPGRGVRVLFSAAGVIADDVIRKLVAEEPPGRVVVVASSDREVVTGVTKSGARTVASSVLLDLLGSGRGTPGPGR